MERGREGGTVDLLWVHGNKVELTTRGWSSEETSRGRGVPIQYGVRVKVGISCHIKDDYRV